VETAVPEGDFSGTDRSVGESLAEQDLDPAEALSVAAKALKPKRGRKRKG
jgi:hypothetical protein